MIHGSYIRVTENSIAEYVGIREYENGLPVLNSAMTIYEIFAGTDHFYIGCSLTHGESGHRPALLGWELVE